MWRVITLLACCIFPFTLLAQDLGGAIAAQPQTFTNTIGMRFRLIPAGEFMMGNEDSAKELVKMFPYTQKVSSENAARQHRVQITKDFYLGESEVTIRMFRKFVSDCGYKTETEKDDKGGWGYDSIKQDIVGRRPEFNWQNTGWSQTDDHPVVNVSWNDATAFCEWLSERESKRYRLPTEAEWEYSCRAGSTTRYQNGNNPEGLVKIGNVWDAGVTTRFPDAENQLPSQDGHVFTAPVKSYSPNGFGLYDMIGNVSEWCSDWYDANYYQTSPLKDPRGPATGSKHTNRGGSWSYNAAGCRSAHRFGYRPEVRSHGIGFRVALDANTIQPGVSETRMERASEE